MATRAVITITLLAALLLAAIAGRLLIGGLGDATIAASDLIAIRAQRVVACAIVGAALALAGAMLQALLRNPLASPDLLGLASGAGLGVMIAVFVASLAGAGLGGASAPAGSAAALAGSFGALVLVYTLSQRRGLLDPISVILVGVMISILCSALIQLIRHMLPDRGMAAERLILGAIRDDLRPSELWCAGAVVAASAVIGVLLAPAMDAASLSDDEARSVGVPLGRLRAALFLLSGALTATAVVLAGAIGFVGLICPHLVRRLAGPAHRPLLLGSALAGAALLIIADAAVRAIDLPSGRMPISIVTALIGGPTLIYLLRREQRGLMPGS